MIFDCFFTCGQENAECPTKPPRVDLNILKLVKERQPMTLIYCDLHQEEQVKYYSPGLQRFYCDVCIAEKRMRRSMVYQF